MALHPSGYIDDSFDLHSFLDDLFDLVDGQVEVGMLVGMLVCMLIHTGAFDLGMYLPCQVE
jgi:hypothetical protein